MIVWGLIVMTTLLQMDSVEADSVHGTGYVGCYVNFHHALRDWQSELIIDDNVTNVDECVDRCVAVNKLLAVITVRSCYCSDRLPNSISKATDSYCNVKCDSNPCQICGSSRHYSVYNTTERLQSSCSPSKLSLHVVNGQPILNCSTCCREGGSTCRSNIQITMITLPRDIHSYISTRDNETTPENNKDLCEEKCICCRPVWLRIVIDAAVILGVLSLVLIIFLIVRCFRHRRRGMFDEWKPRSFGQTGHLGARSPGSGGDLLNRNHSYRNLSGSSTLDRGLESLDQAMVASGGSAVVHSLDDGHQSRYGSLPALATKESVSTTNPRAVTLNSRKVTDVPLAVKDSTSGDSAEGYYHETEFLTPPDRLRNQHVLPGPKNKQRHSSKTSQKECPKDGTEEKDPVLDKPKRRSLLNFLSKDSGKPSFQEPSKDEGASPKDPGSFLDKTWGSRHGNKGKVKTEAAVKRNSSSISEDEKVFEHPKSKTLPNDIYAVPNKPGKRNKQRPNSDANEGAKSGDVEHQEGYSRLSRLFKPRARGGSKPKGGDDTAQSDEYSVLQPDSKDTDYDKLKQQGDTDGTFDQDNNDVAEKPEAEAYASLNDTEYAEVGEETPGAPQSTDYEMIACGQKGQK